MQHVYRRPHDYAGHQQHSKLNKSARPAGAIGEKFVFTANDARAVQFLSDGHVSFTVPHWDSADAFDTIDEFAVVAGVYPLAAFPSPAPGAFESPKILTEPRPAGPSMIVS
jgi:hypothetical protein